VTKDIGKSFEVILIPLESDNIYSYAENLAKQKNFSTLTEEDIEKLSMSLGMSKYNANTNTINETIS
jgi:hypothetical protein